MHKTRNKKGRFVKGHGKVRRSKRRNPKRASSGRRRSRGKRRNPGMPIMLVNPSHKGKRRRRRAATRHNPTRRRRTRRNPSSSWSKSFMAMAKGGLGGGVMLGIDFGIGMLPFGEVAKIAIEGTVGLAASVATAKWVDGELAAGAAGATVFAVGKRGADAYALSSLAAKKPDTASDGGTAMLDSGRVFRNDAGAPPQLTRQTGARSMAPEGMPSSSFREAGAVFRDAGAVLRRQREAGASAFVQGPVRLFGPDSWAYQYTSRGRSAHDSR